MLILLRLLRLYCWPPLAHRTTVGPTLWYIPVFGPRAIKADPLFTRTGSAGSSDLTRARTHQDFKTHEPVWITRYIKINNNFNVYRFFSVKYYYYYLL